MYRIDDPSASPTLPAPEAALTEGYWTEGNPATGTLATLERASWFNMVQEELRAIAVAGGLTPSKTTYNQVLLAIKRLVQNQAVLTDTGAVNAYAAVNTPALVAGTWTNGVTQQIVVAHTNTGPSTYSPDTLTAIPIYGLGLQPLQGNEMFAGGTAIMMKQTIAGVNSGNPIALLLECSGGAQQIAPATAPNHAVQMGQVLGMRAVFTTSGSFTVPAGVTHLWVSGCAGGAGGGCASSGSSGIGGPGAGGGAGQPIIRQLYTVTPGQVIPITIGAGGAGGATNLAYGGAGGNTVIGSLVTLTGGSGGGYGLNISGTAPGALGGAGYPYGSDAPDVSLNTTGGTGGAGASGPFGGGGAGGRNGSTTGLAASPAYGYGAGGGGGGGYYISGAGSFGVGAAGVPGFVMIEW